MWVTAAGGARSLGLKPQSSPLSMDILSALVMWLAKSSRFCLDSKASRARNKPGGSLEMRQLRVAQRQEHTAAQRGRRAACAGSPADLRPSRNSSGKSPHAPPSAASAPAGASERGRRCAGCQRLGRKAAGPQQPASRSNGPAATQKSSNMRIGQLDWHRRALSLLSLLAGSLTWWVGTVKPLTWIATCAGRAWPDLLNTSRHTSVHKANKLTKPATLRATLLPVRTHPTSLCNCWQPGWQAGRQAGGQHNDVMNGGPIACSLLL